MEALLSVRVTTNPGEGGAPKARQVVGAQYGPGEVRGVRVGVGVVAQRVLPLGEGSRPSPGTAGLVCGVYCGAAAHVTEQFRQGRQRSVFGDV